MRDTDVDCGLRVDMLVPCLHCKTFGANKA
jgi:hypothetical protein